jgi:poly-gamma-glutamate synthesis protein (capsule biosynthesis protein)
MSSSVKLLFFGDFFSSKPLTDGFFSEQLIRLIENHDVVGCNIEAPLSGAGGKTRKAGPHLANNVSAVDSVLSTGMSVFSLANNHIMDFGPEGLEKTLKHLKGACLVGAGMQCSSAYALRTIDVDTFKVGFLSYSEAQFGALVDSSEMTPGYAWVNHERVISDITIARESVDFLIVQVHAGVEDVELPLPEWRCRYRALVDAGACAVIGHHPHVVQGCEIYGGAPIYYSLGNFFVDFQASPGTNQAFGLGLTLNLYNDGTVSPRHHWIRFDGKHLTVDASKKYEFLWSELNINLQSPYYKALVDQQVISLFEERYLRFNALAVGALPPRPTLRDWARFFLQKLFPSRFLMKNYALLLHNIRIESNRWCMERAINYLLRSDKDSTNKDLL